MKTPVPIALLIAAASVQGGWIPDSPILRVGEDVDVYFTARARLEYNSNLFTGSATTLPNQGTSWLVGPGLSVDFFKEANFSSSFNYRRDYVRFFNSKLRGLDDERDVGGASFTYDGGGPLTLRLEGNYQEDARNTPETAVQSDNGGTLLRQTNYAQSVVTGYRLTEKLNLSLSAKHSSNRYDPKLIDLPAPLADIYNTDRLTESEGWSFPFDIRYQVRERLNLGFAYEHGHTNITKARNATQDAPYPGFTKDFYGLTLSGQPTTSGKLDATLRVGSLHSVYDGGVDARNSLSYSASLTHTLTEKTNHTLSFSDDASISVNGRRNEGRSYQYVLNYVKDDAFRAAAYVGYTLSDVQSTANIRTGSYGVNMTYSPDSHWVFVASYALTQAYRPAAYDVHEFALEANLRW